MAGIIVVTPPRSMVSNDVSAASRTPDRRPARRARLVAVAIGLVMAAAAAPRADTPLLAAPHRDSLPGDYRITQWTTAQGLPQNSVNDIVRTPDGSVWLATFGGLARFDGERFHVMDMATDAALPTHRVVALAAAGPDQFWYLSQHGHLGRVQRGVASSIVPAASPSVDALTLLADRTGRLFFRSSDGGLWRTDGAQPWRRVERERGHLHSLVEVEDGTLWAAWGSRLVHVTGDFADGRDAGIELPAADVAIFRRAGGGLWIASGNAIAQWLDNRLTALDVKPAFVRRVTAVESAGDGALWVAAGHEVSHVHREPDGSWHREALALGLAPQVAVRTLRAEPDGTLWIGTDGRGLFRLNRPPTHRVTVTVGPAQIGALASDGRGGAFLVNGCRGLFHVDAGDVAREVALRDPLQKERPPGDGCGTGLATEPSGRVWVRAGPDLFRIDNTTLAVRRLPVAVPSDEGPLAIAADGSVWIVSRQGTVHLASTGGRLLQAWSTPSPLVSASLAPDGALWLGGDGQVFRVVRGREEVDRFGADEGVPRGLVRDVLVERDGTGWIGTYGGGIGRLRDGRVTRLSVAQGLPDNSVTRILDDGRGRLWISTNRGVAVCEKSDLNAVADGRLHAFAPVVFGEERGVTEANYGIPGGFSDANGVLWFGTIEGAVRIDAASFPFNATPPVVSIDGVTADDRPLTHAGPVDVPAQTSRIQVTLSAPGLLYPSLTRYRFRVEGVDAGWIDAGPQRVVTWTPPGPGHYRLAFGARNEDGIWSTAPTTIDFQVQPAWWQTATARVSLALGVAFAAFSLFRWRVRAIERRHAEELRRLEEQRTAAEHVASLRGQLEHVSRVALVGELAANLAHEVRQPIGAMVNNAEAGRRHLSKYIEDPESLAAIFGDIVQDGMRASEVIRGVRGFLRPQNAARAPVDLSALVRDMLPLVRRELQDHRVDLALDLAAGLPPVEGVPVQLGQVVVNLVVNACDALDATASPRRLTIATAERNGRVELEVIDNGPGPPPDVAPRMFEPFVTTKPDGLGMGLAICRSIAEAHGGRLSSAPAAAGCRMVLSLPRAGAREAS